MTLFLPTFGNKIVKCARGPAPSTDSTVPSPKVLWDTLEPFRKPAPEISSGDGASNIGLRVARERGLGADLLGAGENSSASCQL